MNKNKYIGIIEDDANYRSALQRLLETQDDLVVSLSAKNACELRELMKDNYVDMLLVDIQLPDIMGNQLVREIKSEYPEVSCVMCTTYLDTEYIISSLSHGASGYIIKTESPSDIINAVRTILDGGAYMSQDLAINLVEYFNLLNNQSQKLDILTPRENEVLAKLSTGLLYKEVAEELNVSVETIKKHTSHIYQKLEVENRTEALIIYNNTKNT